MSNLLKNLHNGPQENPTTGADDDQLMSDRRHIEDAVRSGRKKKAKLTQGEETQVMSARIDEEQDEDRVESEKSFEREEEEDYANNQESEFIKGVPDEEILKEGVVGKDEKVS